MVNKSDFSPRTLQKKSKHGRGGASNRDTVFFFRSLHHPHPTPFTENNKQMRFEIAVLLVVGFFVYDWYHGQKYSKYLWSLRRYYRMFMYAMVALGVYVSVKRNPDQGHTLLYFANNAIRQLPLQRSHGQSNVFDLSGGGSGGDGASGSFLQQMHGMSGADEPSSSYLRPARTVGGGGGIGNKATKRSVSETKKKFVAANQNWQCGHCNNMLDHTFEIDHKVRLEYGGSNDASNLVALCRNCHGRKTASENM